MHLYFSKFYVNAFGKNQMRLAYEPERDLFCRHAIEFMKIYTLSLLMWLRVFAYAELRPWQQ